MGKYKDEFLYCDPNTTIDMVYCWNRGFYYYPILVPNQTVSMRYVPKVKIEWKSGKESGQGEFTYDQNQELYDVIYRLYIHKAKQLRDK